MFRLFEVAQGTFGEVFTLKVDNALVQFGIGALVNRKCKMAFAHKMRGRFNFAAGFAQFLILLEVFFVKGGAGANFSFGSNIYHNHGDSAVALGLQGEKAFVFEGAGEHGGEDGAFGHNGSNRTRVAMFADDGVENAAHTDKTSLIGAVINEKDTQVSKFWLFCVGINFFPYIMYLLRV